jgi:hypothetical protein
MDILEKPLMKKLIPLAALIAGVAIAPQAVLAQGTMTTDTGTMMVCRAAKSSESAVAYVNPSKAAIVCRPIDMKAWMAGPPGMASMKSADDVNKAWQKFLSTQLQGGGQATDLQGGGAGGGS